LLGLGGKTAQTCAWQAHAALIVLRRAAAQSVNFASKGIPTSESCRWPHVTGFLTGVGLI
jgi:hypothetical protein